MALHFHPALQTSPERLQKYVELCSERYDGSNSFLTTVRYGHIPLSELRVGVDEPIFTSCSSYFGYVYNGNVNAASSRSSSRSKPHDNLMIEEPFNCNNFGAVTIPPVL
ncbi:hypothetical protein RAM19_05945 [Bartonella apihabitans]|uniref:hypothetical protein n=1 Tax=uncultured Bartonella sp. TaxID=104108 RepID=UPI0025CB9D0B|nr:hypothetical protein [uncultured Bartonella sp.]WLT09672.1 hypothetical protein RAM19_05945 [Bartonella apihabitans]